MQIDLDSALAKQISKLKFDTTTSILAGDYKSAIKSSKELAEIAVDNFELTTKVKSPYRGQMSIFSKEGLHSVLFILLNKIRKKTPAEKRFSVLNKMYKQGNIRF